MVFPVYYNNLNLDIAHMKETLLKTFMAAVILALLAGCSQQTPPAGRMPPTLKLSQAAPNFSFDVKTTESSSQNSKAIPQQLKDYKGKVVYLDFWASWCTPCATSMPQLNQLREKIKDQGFEVLAVNLDESQENTEKFLEKHPVDYPIILPKQNDITSLYQVMGLPTAYLIDRNGIVRHAFQGFKPGDKEAIESAARKLL